MLELVEGRLIEYLAGLHSCLSQVNETRGFYLPVYYFNYFSQCYQHFGFIIVTNMLISRHRALFVYYPLEFFTVNHLTSKGNDRELISVLRDIPEYALNHHVDLFNIRGVEKS